MPAKASRKRSKPRSGPRARRFRQLKAAVELAGTTMERFAEGLNVTSQHIRLVVYGARESPRVDAAVDDLIARHLPTDDAGEAA